MGETVYGIGNQVIYEHEVQEQVNEILKILKERKQTYAVNKFVLEQSIENCLIHILNRK